MCGPNTCTKSDYLEIIYSNTNIVNLYLSSVIPDFPNNSTNVYFPSEEQDSLELSPGRIIMIIVVILLILLGIFSTSISILSRKIRGFDYFLCFSFYDNLKDLVTRKQEDRVGNVFFDILDGVRVMGLGWVILGRVTMQISIYSIIANIFELENKISQLNITFIYGGYYAVDTNFWISGFLSGYFILKILKKGEFS